MNRLVLSGFVITPTVSVVNEEDTATKIPFPPSEVTVEELAVWIEEWPTRWAQIRSQYAANQRDHEALLAAEAEKKPPRQARRAAKKPAKKAAAAPRRAARKR